MYSRKLFVAKFKKCIQEYIERQCINIHSKTQRNQRKHCTSRKTSQFYLTKQMCSLELPQKSQPIETLLAKRGKFEIFQSIQYHNGQYLSDIKLTTLLVSLCIILQKLRPDYLDNNRWLSFITQGSERERKQRSEKSNPKTKLGLLVAPKIRELLSVTVI